MIERSHRMEISILYKQGNSLKSIARELGMSINTVRRYVRNLGQEQYKSRPPVVAKLDPYKAYIESRLRACEAAKIPGTVLLREIKDMGYTGGITRLRDFVYNLKKIDKEEPIVRFETEPGRQMQIDWAEFRKGKNRLAAFTATLGFSRYSFVQFVTDEKLETLLQCHKKVFEFINGVPHEILYDNMKTVVIERDAFGEGQHRFHKKLWDFAKHYGFRPRLCRPYRAKTKGKVERFIGYLRYSFYHPLAARYSELGLSVDVELANAEVNRWLKDVANVRVHGTTKKIPLEEMALEQSHLQRVPEDWQDIEALSILLVQKEPKAIVIAPDFTHETTALQHDLAIYDELLLEVQQ